MSDLEEMIGKIGAENTLKILKEYWSAQAEENVMTIVSNKGAHHLPEYLKRGEIYYATEGNLDFSSLDAVLGEYNRFLSDLSRLLKSKTWKKIYLVPFGHSTISMQVKLLVYRITRIETIDVFYNGKGAYFDISIDQRHLIVE